MTLKSFLFRKKMERHLVKEKVPLQPKILTVKNFMREWWAWTIKPKMQVAYAHLKVINRLPFSILFTIYLIVVFVSMGLFSQVIYQKWVNDIITTYPESVVSPGVDEAGNVQLSPLDSIFIPIQSKNQAWYFLMFHTVIGMFFTDVWSFYNPRKPQSFHLRGAS